MANIIELREINKLIKEKFYIPTYQRGYRWDKQQVVDLLEDIFEFKNKANISNGEFYCLQPIVVKKREDGRYDVVDGQQRLTTIMIIQKYLEKRTYSIEYQSRENSSFFLDNISQYADEIDINNNFKNIDFFFMADAYRTVRDWFETKIELNEEYSLPDEFNTYLLKYCKVIWYEVDETTNAESVFTRLNIGKIPLTNAELIKSLFLKSSNFDVIGDPSYLKQLEIASEWDRIENSLQDDKIWFFINPKYLKTPDTRIEYIFDLISSKTPQLGENYTFIYYNNRLKNETIFELWEEIKNYFNIIMEWYNNQVLFHKIGFITSSRMNISIRDLISVYFNNEYKKFEFITYIDSLISDYFNGIEIESLSYQDNVDSVYIRDVLLLFNIMTVMEKSNAYSRFPFDSYNKNKWSLEHIHAQNADGLGNDKSLWLNWIDEHIASFKDFKDEKYSEIVTMLENINRDTITKNEFDALFNNIVFLIREDYGVDLHSIDNLALLDIDANSSISNNFFDVKRQMILKKDRDGDFIPVCTRNVFLKYYSNNPSQIQYWSEQDRQDYLLAIKDKLSVFGV